MPRLIDADALWMEVIHTLDYCDDILEIIEHQKTIEPTHHNASNTLKTLDCIGRREAIDAMEKINLVFNGLNLSCAYDMPSFWCHDGKDYKVIPTKYHKGYQQALSDA